MPAGAAIPPDLAARLIRIDDPDDPRVAVFRNIKERDLRGRQGIFIAEGTVVLRVLAESHAKAGAVRAECVLVLENRLRGVASLLEAFAPDVPVMVASRAVIDAIAGFAMHRGILAAGTRPVPPSAATLIGGLAETALVLVASAVSNHDNMGALFRNAAALGADALILDQASCDPLYRKAIRVSVGSALMMPYAHGEDIGAIGAMLRAAGFATIGLSPRGREDIATLALSPRTALVVGTEGEGLAPSVMAGMQTARIAQSGRLDSLNLATAAGIALHTVARRMGRLS